MCWPKVYDNLIMSWFQETETKHLETTPIMALLINFSPLTLR